MLKEFESSMLTSRNLKKQCVEAFEVTYDTLHMVLSILEMSGRRINFQALTQIEVLHFVSLWPFCLSDEFDQYRAEHPDLDPFPPNDYGFGTTDHAAEVGTSNQEGVS